MNILLLKDKKSLVYNLFLVVIITVAYWKIFSIFYQQDEWLTFGRGLVVDNISDLFGNRSIFQILLGEGRFIPFAIGNFFFQVFPFNAMPFAVFSLFFHLVNSLLVFGLAKRFLKNYLIAFLAALFFGINSVSSNAVSWFGTSLGTLPSVTLVLVGLFTFFRYLDEQRKPWLFATFFSLYFSLFFKEIGIHLFLLLPLLGLLFRREKLKTFVSTYWYFFAFFLLNSVVRVLEMRSLEADQAALFLTNSSYYFWQILLVRAILYLLTSFSLVFIPASAFVEFSRTVTRIYYPFIPAEQFLLLSQTAVLDILSVLLTFLIFLGAVFLTRRSSKLERSSVLFWVGFTLVSFFPYVVISKNYSYLESRYYYLAAASAGIIFALLVGKILLLIKRIQFRVVMAVFSIIFLLWHANELSKDLEVQKIVSQERQSFLAQLSRFIPSLESSRNVFFITSDADYYQIDNKVPFQQGTGYTLMVRYFTTGKIPRELLDEQPNVFQPFLYALASQGYKESGGMGFGYYWDEELLKNEIKQKKFSKDDVLPFYYDSKTKILSEKQL